ncbi:MAG: pyruvate kinase, partial [Pseudomonadales bacterium]|nr:pyruvate kinase [Pseudomonadales bacterium]
MIRRTKIVATIGPASSDEHTLGKLIDAGVNVFRLNFSHGSQEGHKETAQRIHGVSAQRRKSVAILADLQGPKIRIARFQNGKAELKNGANFVLDAEYDEENGNTDIVGLGYKSLPSDCEAGDTLLLNDGLIELKVDAVDG